MKKRKNATSPRGESPSRLIDARITSRPCVSGSEAILQQRIGGMEELGDWRGETLSRIRSLIKQADPEVVEEWKWRGVPVWSHDGLICTGETYKNVVKLTFFKGAQLRDPSKLFNSSLEGNARRAIGPILILIEEARTLQGRTQGTTCTKAPPLTTPPSRLSSAPPWR